MSCSAMPWGNGGPAYRANGRRGGWRPFELAAMIGGFVLFWPVGLAILAAKGWREGWWGPNARREGQDRSNDERGAMPWQRGSWSRGWAGRGFGGFGGPEHDWSRELNRDTGNLAFEDYKTQELQRLQAEFERLAADQRAFGEHIEALRRAKDKAEFDSFIASRRAAGPASGPAPDARGDGPAQGPGEPPAA